MIDFDAFDSNPRAQCKRSDTVILVKNIPATAKEHELSELFSRHGSLKRFLLSPFNTLAIAEYETGSQAASAMKSLAYHRVNFITPIYLEYAPTGLVVKSRKRQNSKEEVTAESDDEKSDEKKDEAVNVSEKQQRQIFVKNLNFKTNELPLEELFKKADIGKVKAVKIVRRSDTQQSRGYGFIEVES